MADKKAEIEFYGQAGLHVAIYDVMAAAVPGGDDVAFYESLAQETGGPILDIGCGSGRVAIPLAVAGFEVTGIDRSSAMLARARARARALEPDVAPRLRFIEGDLETTVAGEHFGLAFAAFRVFMSVLEPDAQLQALRTIRGQIRPGGLLAIDVFDPRYDLSGPGLVGPVDRGTYQNPDSGRDVRVTAVERQNDPILQRLDELWRFEELDAAGDPVRVELERLTLRWTFRYEMRHLLARAGFEPVAEYSDYDRSPPAYGSEQIWVAARTDP